MKRKKMFACAIAFAVVALTGAGIYTAVAAAELPVSFKPQSEIFQKTDNIKSGDVVSIDVAGSKTPTELQYIKVVKVENASNYDVYMEARDGMLPVGRYDNSKKVTLLLSSGQRQALEIIEPKAGFEIKLAATASDKRCDQLLKRQKSILQREKSSASVASMGQ